MKEDKKRLLRIVGLAAALCVLAGLVWFFFVSPWLEYDARISDLNEKIFQVQRDITKKIKEKNELEKFRLISLPTNIYVARREYERFLNDLLTESGFHVDYLHGSDVQVQNRSQAARPGAKKETPVYQPVLFEVRGLASVKDLAVLLDRFHRTPLLHKIKTMSLESADAKAKSARPDVLQVSLAVEALIVKGADARGQNVAGVDERLVELDVLSVLRGGPAGLALVPWALGPSGPFAQRQLASLAARRDYSIIARNNVFVGERPPVKRPDPEEMEDPADMKQFTYLIGISINGIRAEAYLRNRYTNKYIRLRSSSIFNKFTITDEFGERVVMEGKVRKIDAREVYFEYRGEIYRLHVGENISQALSQQPLSDSEMAAAGLKTVAATQ